MDSNWVFLAAIIVIVFLLMWGVPCSAEPKVQETTTVITTPDGSPVAVVKTATAVAPAAPAIPKKTDPLTQENVATKKSYGFATDAKTAKPIERFAVGLSDNYEQIRTADGRCLAVSGDSGGLSVVPCTASSAQYWKTYPSQQNGYMVETQGATFGGACLSYDDANMAVVRPCTDAISQQWDVLDLAQGAKKKDRQLRNSLGQCLDISPRGLVIAPCTKNSSQRWTF